MEDLKMLLRDDGADDTDGSIPTPKKSATADPAKGSLAEPAAEAGCKERLPGEKIERPNRAGGDSNAGDCDPRELDCCWTTVVTVERLLSEVSEERSDLLIEPCVVSCCTGSFDEALTSERRRGNCSDHSLA
mmetsp:Transcript_139656/g.363103  ORF Transcript_139656/g.363103 Transcript_139656/m.363103 type:complete len:132 (+) Transcript_139656:69-464(+)